MLIAASITLDAISKLESSSTFQYEDTGSYKGAAGWLLFLGVAAIIYHAAMIFIRVLYFMSTIINYFTAYAFIVSGFILDISQSVNSFANFTRSFLPCKIYDNAYMNSYM